MDNNHKKSKSKQNKKLIGKSIRKEMQKQNKKHTCTQMQSFVLVN